jgi:hypothetical protein
MTTPREMQTQTTMSYKYALWDHYNLKNNQLNKIKTKIK